MPIFDELAAGIVSRSPEDTSALAARLAGAMPPDAILALQGDLGVGKTTFVKGLAAAWGVNATVKSPTYNLVSIHEGSRQLVHLDAYRLASPEAIDGLMLEEFLRSPFCLVVEWPERIADWFPPATLWLEITMDAAHHRHFRAHRRD
jgi:tRNA threonylcarbamoyladenosine biosynthesis protein TsaE